MTRAGATLAAVNGGVLRLEGERWEFQAGPAVVTALAAPGAGPEALAGGREGVWALADNAWHQEVDSPRQVSALAAGPAGSVWALTGRLAIWERDAAGWHQAGGAPRDAAARPLRDPGRAPMRGDHGGQALGLHAR